MGKVDNVWPYVWNWNKWPSQPDSWQPGNRKGQRCRVLARGAGNARLVEFEDGLVVRTSGNGLRKPKKEKVNVKV